MSNIIDKMYDDLKAKGYLSKDRATFNKFFFAPGKEGYENRKKLYDDLHSKGYLQSSSYEDFAQRIGLHSVRPSQTASRQQNVAQQANTNAAAQAAAAKSAPTQPTKGGWRPNAEQMAGYQKFTDGVLRTVKNGDDVMNRVNRRVARAKRPNQQKVNLGFNNKHSLLGGGSQVQHEGKKFDAAKGDFVDQYSTEAGNVYDNTYEADAEQYNINRNKRDADTLDAVADIERQIREQEELLEKTRKASRDVKAPDNLWDAIRYTMSHADGSRLDQEDIDEEAIKANITNLQNRRSLLLHGTSIGQKVGKSIGDQLAEVNRMIGDDIDNYYKRHPNGGPTLVSHDYHATGQYQINPYLDVAARSLEDAQEMFNEAGKSVGESGLTGFGKGVIRGFGSKLFDARTWDMGFTDIKGGLSLAEVLRKADEGKPLTVEQQKMLDAKATELACAAYFSGALGRGYKAGQVTAESIPFMLEFMLNPLSGTGRSAQAMLTRYALKRFGRKATMELGEDAAKKILYGDIRQLTKSVFDKGLSKGARRLAAKTLAGKASARIAGDITGAAGMTFTTGQGRVVADMLNRATGQVKFGVDTDGKVKYTGHDAPEESSLLTAYGKAFGSQFSENYSEFMGPYISYVGGMFANGLKKIGGKYLFDGLSSLRNRSAAAVMKLPFAPMVSDFIREATKSDWAKVIKGMQKRAHWDGTAEEYLEEVAGNMLNAILVGDNDFSTEEGRGVFNLSDNIDTFLGVGLMSGAMSVASAAGYRTPAYRARKMVENADSRGEKLLGSSLWGKFKSSFDAAQSEQDKQVILTSLLQNSSLTDEGRRAVLQYARGKQFQQAVADGTFREMEEDAEKGNEVERACRAEYTEGQNIDSVEEMRDAKTRYNVLLREALAVEPNAEMYSDPQFYEQSNPNATPEQKAAMRAYAEAKAQYEGVADRMKTDMADQQQKANEQVERFKNQTDGLITRVRLRGSDAEFYVTSGHISLNNDGTINDAATSSNLTIVDGEGNQRFISRGDVVDVLAQNTPEETLEQLNDIIMNEAKAKADLIDGKLSFRAGDTFTILNNEGQEQKATIAQDPSTMAMSAVIEGEQAAVPLTEDSMAKLQQMSDAYQESRFGKYRQEQQDAVANAENEATQEESTPTSPTASQEEASSPTGGRSYGYGESVSYVDGEGHTQEGVVHGKTPDGTYEVEFDNPPSGKNVVDEYTQEELDALVQPIPAGQTEEAIPEPTALERVPINEETGEPMFEKADSETALDALNEVTGGNEDNTTAIVRAQVEQATKALEALKKKKPSKKAPSLKGSPLAMVKAQQEAEANYNTAMEEYNAQVAAAEENLNAWSRINSLMNDRKRAIREQQEAERKAREEELHAEAVARLEEDKRIAAEKAAEQEAVGTHAVNPKIKAKWDGATKVEGNPNAITLADGSTIRGHYVLTEAGAATASHDVNNAYEPTEGFPVDENGESVNDRDYKRDRDAQRIVRDMADSYDGRALQSPVIVSKDGVVLSGNNRTMSGEIAARQGTDKAYVAHLREFGAMFGFTPEQIDGMQHPRVVFVPDEELPYDANTFARFNAEQQKKQSKPEHAVKLGKIVPDNVFTSIVGDISRFDRMSDYYADGKAAASAISQLLDAGVINEMQLSELRTGNALSAAGKELIENTLIGKVFQTSPDAVRQIISTPTLRQSVVMGLNEIANNRTLAKSGYDLSKELAAAVDLVSRAKAEAPEIYKEGMPVSPYGRQQGLFDDEYGDSRVTDGVTLLLADLLNSGKPSDLRKVLSTYNHEAASPAAGLMDMFSGDVPSKEEVLNHVLNHFRNATPKEQQAIVDAAIAERKRRAEAAEPGGGSQGGEQTENAVRGSEETSAENLGGNQADGIQEKLTEEEADAMLDRMKSIADPMPEVELTPENWMNTFGLSNKIDTPIGEVKMGESQYAKLMEKKRSKEFGMVVGTITDPDVVFIEPSSAKDGQVTERAYSYVFVKTFKKEDENVRYYSSVTVSIDGMEISVSSHYINSNKAKKKLLELNRRYTKTALISNSSDWRLAEQQDAVPDLLPTQENNAVSDLPFPKDGVSVGEDTANSTELQGNGKESSHKGFVPDEKVIEENVQRSERALGIPSSVKREKTEVKVSDNGKVMVIKTDYSANGSKASVITLLAENDGQLDWAAQSFVDGKPTSELKYDYTLSHDDMMEMFDDNGAIRQDINPLKQIARNAGIDIDALLNGKEHGTKVSIEASREKTSENEGGKPLSAQIEDASAEVNTDPTEAQKEAGNYKKGHVQVGSFDITIEQPQGSVRKGTDANGKQWESKMNNTYGYFRGTEGVDGDHIDVFLSNDIDGWNRQTVFVVDQYNPDGSFDEHKVMLGFNNAEEAKRDYLANYEKGWENSRRIDVSAVNLADFEKWIASSHRKTKPFSEYSSVKKEGSASSETKQSKSTADEKPFNAIIEMLRKKFPDASMEALTAADRLLREQALPGERQKAIEAVAKALGLKVEWRDTMEKENGTFNPKTRTITIARDSEHALANTFGHEVTHAVRNLSEADYKNLKDAVRRLYSSEKEYNEAVQAYGDMYTGLDFDALEEELIADNIGFMIGGRNDMTQELASRMNHRVLWAIHDAMNKVRNALAKVLHIDSKKNGLLEALDSAKATIRETMANAQRIAKGMGQGLSNESDSTKQSLRTQDTAIRDALVEHMRLSGMDVIADEEGQRVLDMANGQGIKMSFGEPYDYDNYPRGRVESNLNKISVKIVDTAGNDKGFLNYVEAEKWAKEHLCKVYTDEETGGKGEFSIVPKVINKYVSKAARDKSDNEYLHYVVLQNLPSIIHDSIDTETHPNFTSHGAKKEAGVFTYDKNTLVHVLYGAVKIGDKLCRVKLTAKEYPNNERTKPYSFMVTSIDTEIESLEPIGVQARSEDGYSNNSISAAKLLNGVEMSYDKGKNLLEESKKRSDSLREQRVYHGSGAEFDHFDHVRFFRTANGEAYGFTVGGKIYIDPRIATSETPIHEYAHLWATALKSANAKEWQNVVGLMKGTKVWDEVKALYPELKSDDEIADEVLATYSGRRGAERLREEQRRIAKGNGGVFEKAEAISALERVKQALKRFWKGVADFLHIHYTSAEEVADRVMKDLLDGVDPRKFGDGGKSLDAYNKIRKHFIGEQGAERADHAEEVTTRIDNLNVAREMEDAKKDAKAIKMATGWERGADGKWRYEIPDLKYFGKGDAGYKKARGKQPWSKELDGLSDKIFDGEELSESEYRRFDELVQKEDDFKTDYLNREKPHLADWVENDELFKAYPDLKRVNVVFTDQLPTNVGGSYNEREHTIVVNTNYVGDIDSVLAHEVQHAIQKIEGFARGGNPESIQERFKAAKKEWRARAWADELRYKADEMGEHYNQAAVEKALIDEYKEMGMDNEEWMPDKETRMKGFNYFARGYADRSMDADIKNFRLAESARADFSPYMEYTKLGGEVESRNVEKRMKMSPEERRASLAAETEDVSREDQIFLFGEGGTSMKTSSDLNEMFGSRWLDEQTRFSLSDDEELSGNDDEFNRELDAFRDKSHKGLLHLGRPLGILRACGIRVDEMTISPSVLYSHLKKHGLTTDDLKGLARSVQSPILVYRHGKRSPNIVAVTELDVNGGKLSASFELDDEGHVVEVSNISSIHSKEAKRELERLYKMGEGDFRNALRWVEKEKVLAWLAPSSYEPSDMQSGKAPFDIANVLINFENPKISDENVADEGIMFRNGGAADAEKQSRRGTPNLYPDHIAQAIYEQSVNGFKFDLDEAWHDSLLSVKRLQEAISETRGVPIRDFENAYWHAVALSSVNAAEMEQLMNLRIQPFIEAVQDICKKHDLTQEDIEVYLNCKHGLERNEAMARRDAEKQANEEFKDELRKAERAAAKDPLDQDAADALDDVKQRMNDREEELYFENREKDYSGLTDIFDPKDKVTGDRLDLTVSELEDKAKKCVDDFENKVGVVDVTKLWDNIHELNNYSLRKSYLSGLISKSQYDSVKQMYQWYVPLRGFNEEVAGDVYTYVTRSETRTQQLLKEAKGRTSRAGDILATMMNMANSAVNQGNRNLMKQKILNLALNAKSPLLSVSSTWYQTDANGFDVPIEPPINDQMTPSEQKDAIEQWEDTMEMQAKQGKVHRMSDNLRLNLRTQKWQADEHCIRVQRGGKEYCVWVNGNPRAAQALNDRLGNQVTKPYKATETILDKAEDLFTDGFIKIFRYMAQSVTSLNPEFVISNFQRDLASASLVSTGKYGVGYTKDFLVNVKRLGVLTGTMSHKKEYRNAAGIYTLYNKYKSGTLDNNNEMERYFAEFMQNGGETGYTQSLSIKDYQSRIQSALGDKGFVKWSKNAGHAVADFVEMANRGVENTCRFAAYMTSRQHGKSVLQAIVDAKEASTNFNLHGAGGFGNAWLRKSIIFINPAVQSIVQYCQLTAKHPKAMLSMLGGTILLGAAMAFACASMVAPGGGDPDSNYWDLSDYVRHNYIVIPSGNGNWTRIALPPEIRAVYGLGVIAMEAAMGRMNHSSIPAAIGDQLMQFSPVAFLDPRNFFNRSDSDHSVGKTLIKAFTPTLASPIADAYIWDEDFMGRQITGRNDFNEDKPEFQRVSYDTLPQLVSFSRWLNNISGGNDYKKGWINVNPSSAGYVASQYLGGPLQFFTKIGKTVAMITYEDLRDMRNVPFLSRFMTSTDNDYGRNQVSNAEFKYWSAIADDVRTQIRGFEKEIESGDTKNLDDYKKLVSSKEYEMYQMIDYMDWLKDIRELNQKRKEETTQDAQKQVTLEIYEVRRKMAECLNKAEEMGVYLDMSQLNLELANAKTTEERAAIQAKINEKRKENLKKIGAIE